MSKFFSFTGPTLFVLYSIGFLFAFSGALPSYISSSYLSKFTGVEFVGIVFSLCSFLTLIAFIWTPKYLKKYGNYRMTLYLSLINLLATLGLALFSDGNLVLISYAVAYVTGTIISFCLDIFIEHDSTNTTTGNIRGVYLTTINVAWLVVPWLSALILGVSDYWKVYLVSAAIMLPIFLLITHSLKSFKDPDYAEFKFFKTIKEAWAKHDVKRIFAASIVLQFFFAWMVIYTPIYLNTNIGFDWQTIAIIFTIMLVPFVVVQIPLGDYVDKRHGEREILSFGFIIMAISTALISLVDGKAFWVWVILLFTTRIGASMVQLMTDVYFFKHISEKDVNLISLYRMIFPITYIVAPLAAMIFLMYFPFSYLFLALGFFMVFGLIFSFGVEDDK